MVQLERGRRNGFGEAAEQSVLATAERQHIIQTKVNLKKFAFAILKFALIVMSVVRESGEASSF
jgi:hypothetical protein